MTKHDQITSDEPEAENDTEKKEDTEEEEAAILSGESAFNSTTCLLPENPLADVFGKYIW